MSDHIEIDRRTWNHGIGYNAGDLACLSIALAGAHADAVCDGPECRISSSGLQTYDLHPENYFDRLPAGALFIDKRTVPDDLLWIVVVRGPMLDVNLPDRTIRRFNIPGPDPETRHEDHAGRWLAFIATATQNTDPTCPRSLDSISLDLYTELWQAAGALVYEKQPDGTMAPHPANHPAPEARTLPTPEPLQLALPHAVQ